MRIALARAISIAGHPVVLVSVAGLIAASTQGAPIVELQTIGVALALLTAAVLGFMVLQVAHGTLGACRREQSQRAPFSQISFWSACFSLVHCWFGTSRMMPTCPSR